MGKLLRAIGPHLWEERQLVLSPTLQQSAERATGVLATNFDRSTNPAQMSTVATATEPEVGTLCEGTK